MGPLHTRKAEVLKKDEGSLLAEDSKAWGRDVGSLKGAHKKVSPFQSLHEGCAFQPSATVSPPPPCLAMAVQLGISGARALV